MSRDSPESLLATVSAARELMRQRIEADSLDGDARRAMQAALAELDVMWQELQGEAALLVRENERYAEFFQYAPDAYLITDAGGNVREVNQAALELLQAARADVVGQALSAYIAEEDRPSFLARTVGLMPGAGVEPLAWQARLKPAGCEALTVELSVRAVALQKSAAGGLCWLLR